MKRKLPIAILLGFALSAWTGYAQEENPKSHPPPKRPPMIMVLLDTDKDGTISADEIKNAEAALNNLDKNGDGKLTKEEMRPPHDSEGKKGKPKKKPTDQ